MFPGGEGAAAANAAYAAAAADMDRLNSYCRVGGGGGDRYWMLGLQAIVVTLVFVANTDADCVNVDVCFMHLNFFSNLAAFVRIWLNPSFVDDP